VFISSEIEHLQLRKQVLLMESELNRRNLELDWSELKGSARSSVSNLGSGLAGSIRPWAMGLAPILGFLLIRRWRSSKGLFVKAMLLWQTAKRVLKIWQFMKKS
jgi:hypothetical protein